MARVLIVDDGGSGADPLAGLVEKEGFTSAVVSAAEEVLEEIDSNGTDLILLDLAWPGRGPEVCRQLRQRSMVPVIIVSESDSEIDKVVGLEVGADDYVTKPYSARELIARVRAVIRRSRAASSEACECSRAPRRPAVVSVGPVRVDAALHAVTVRGVEVRMPLKEFDLLSYMVRNAGRVLSRRELIERVWGADYVGDTKTLDVHIRRLRSKIEEDPTAPDLLLNVRGLGFMFST